MVFVYVIYQFPTDTAFGIHAGHLVQVAGKFLPVFMESFPEIIYQVCFGMLFKQTIFNNCRNPKKAKGKNEKTVFVNF